MSITGYKRLTVGLAIISFVLLLLCCLLFWNNGWLTIRVAWAEEQTKIFAEMRTRALQSDVAEAASNLEYVVGYYPSGSKQESGSRLDRIVERQRALATVAIVAHLRAKTGEDLGENPEPWVRKYAKR